MLGISGGVPPVIGTILLIYKTMEISPAALIIFPIAILLDAVGLLLLCLGLDDFGILDIIGIIAIGGWIFFRSRTLKATKGAAQTLTQVSNWTKRLKWLRPLSFILELVPYVGAAPCWTILVWGELQSA